MIEINLLPGLKRKAPGGGKLRIPDLRAILANVKDPWLLSAIAAAVLAIGGNATFLVVNGGRLGKVERELTGVQAEKRRYDAVAAQKRQAERVRDSLSAEMAIIRDIDADRYIWPHLLDEITKALPAYTWVIKVSFVGAAASTGGGPSGTVAGPDTTATNEVHVSIDGRTVDIQAYTAFLRQLAASPWIDEVLPTRAAIVIEQDRPVTEFNIMVRYRTADSVYIRRVPLVESVR